MGPQNHIEGTTKRTSIGLYLSTTNFLLTTQNPYMTLKRKFHCYQNLNDQIEQANQAAQIEGHSEHHRRNQLDLERQWRFDFSAGIAERAR